MQDKEARIIQRVKEELNADDVHLHFKLLHDCARRRRHASYKRARRTCGI